MEQTKPYRKTNRRVPVASLTVAAFALGGLSASFAAVGTAGAATSHATKSVVISTAKNSKLGTILVSAGRTLYTLAASKAGCTGSCAKAWPEVVLPTGVKSATAGSGCKASELGTVTRPGGVHQVTYAGKALYMFSGDKAGTVNGNGVKDSGGTWSVVVTAKLTKSSSSSSSGGSAGAGTTAGNSPGGYGY